MEFFCRVIAIHGKQVMTKPVHPGEQEGRDEPTSQPCTFWPSNRVSTPVTLLKAEIPWAEKGTVSARVEGSTRELGHSPFFLLHIHYL